MESSCADVHDVSQLWTVVQPFPLIFSRDDAQGILFFEGHPTCESAEAMISERPGEDPSALFIVSRHDQTQILYTNNASLVEEERRNDPDSKIVFASIECTRGLDAGAPRLFVRVISERGERMELDLCAAGDVSVRRGHLFDPGDHAKEQTLPVMSPQRTMHPARESSVTFDGVRYPVSALVGGPLSVQAARGSYSEGYRMGVFLSGQARLQVAQHPAAIEVGERLVYRRSDREEIYTITEVEGACFVLTDVAGQQIHLVRSSGGLHLQQIRLHARSIQEREASVLAMCFEPPLPLGSSLSEGDLQEVGFRISIDDEGDLITGTVRAHRTRGEVHLLLAPEEPAWSAQRRVSIRITEAEPRSFTIDTEIVPPP